MIYTIDGNKVSKETFEQELEVYIKDYIPYTKYWTPKDKVKEELETKKRFRFPVYDKRKLILKRYVTFVAMEEEIAEIESIVIQHEEDSLEIAVGLYNSGYRNNRDKEIVMLRKSLEEKNKIIKDLREEVAYYQNKEMKIYDS